MNRWLVHVTVRVIFALFFLLIVIAGPVYYLLFVPNLSNPLSAFAHWRLDQSFWRIIGALSYISIIGFIFGYAASRDAVNPFDELAASIRRIATRDFRTRIPPSKHREPREMHALTDAFNTMAANLEHSEALRTNMMADVAHELRTPLTALEGSLRAALDHVYTLDEAEIAQLYGQTRHLIRLVNDLHELALAEARQLPLDRQPTALSEIIEEIMPIFSALADEQGVTLRNTMPPLPMLNVDPARMRQVFYNLLTNALRHTPQGGEIELSSAVEDGWAVLAVRDSGEGIDPEHLSAVFDRFYRIDRSRSRDTGGTGLGLAIVSAIVAGHGGNISAASAGLGKGSTFTVRLPFE